MATAPASAAALTKVTSNDPGATLELEPALTGRVGSRGETGCVDAFLVTLN